MIVNVHEAKTQLSKLLKRIETHGEGIVIARDGVSVARLVPMVEKKVVWPFGMDRGRVQIADDFDAPMSEEDLG